MSSENESELKFSLKPVVFLIATTFILAASFYLTNIVLKWVDVQNWIAFVVLFCFISITLFEKYLFGLIELLSAILLLCGIVGVVIVALITMVVVLPLLIIKKGITFLFKWGK